MSNKLVAGIILAAMMMGCAQLRIAVDVYRGPIPVAWEQAWRVSTAAVAVTSDEARQAQRSAVLGEIDSKVTAALKKKFASDKELLDKALLAWQGATAPELTSGVKQSVEIEWNSVDQAAQRLNQAASTLKANLNADPTQQIGTGVSSAYANFRLAREQLNQAWTNFVTKIKTALTEVLSVDTAVLGGLENHFVSRAIATSDTVEGRLVGSPLFDPRIPALSRAEQDWVSFGANSFDAFWGTSQFVVVREGLVVYHQKSLDFDPTSAVGAGSALSRLGLKVAAAQASGIVPMPKAEGSDAGDATATTAPLFDADAVEQNRVLLERRRNARHQFLRAMASLLERSEILGAASDSINKELNREITYYLGRTAKEASAAGATATQ